MVLDNWAKEVTEVEADLVEKEVCDGKIAHHPPSVLHVHGEEVFDDLALRL